MGYFLRATVSYDDGEGDGKTAMAKSVETRGAGGQCAERRTPAFPDQDSRQGPESRSEAATRMVGGERRAQVRT